MKDMLKSPIYRDGMIFCSYCRMPLLTVEETHLKLKCAVCQKPLEMEARKRLSHNKP